MEARLSPAPSPPKKHKHDNTRCVLRPLFDMCDFPLPHPAAQEFWHGIQTAEAPREAPFLHSVALLMTAVAAQALL